ncbi:hypothetical protein HW115_14865 [Verrucomicrobiaceae bacterium N1E253]|uniref:Uncharacterized protein n=2 Tax=Oceaniferula marina TaxID=2748318 RepID=A0A851GH98_9BACT|nr:hypothetical protein [Oceaniferula marina]
MFRPLCVVVLASSLGLTQAQDDAAENKPAAVEPGKVPAAIAAYLAKDKPVMGEVGAIVPPKEINKYIAKVQAAAKADTTGWHKEYASKSKPGLPLPYHENLGLTKAEYDEYLKLWDDRQFKAAQKVVLRLEEPKPGEWMVRVSGVGGPISLLRYLSTQDAWKSTNGQLKRIEDIDAAERSILGAWKGKEWRFEEKTDFVWTTENIALGKYNDGKFCLLIYRIQERISGYDKSMVIRFAPPAAAKK